jgi:hypothetical protein
VNSFYCKFDTWGQLSLIAKWTKGIRVQAMPYLKVLNAAIISIGPAFYPSAIHVVFGVDFEQQWKYFSSAKHYSNNDPYSSISVPGKGNRPSILSLQLERNLTCGI